MVGHVLIERLLENCYFVVELTQLVVKVGVVFIVFLLCLVNHHAHVLGQIPVLFGLPLLALCLILHFLFLVFHSVCSQKGDLILIELFHQFIQFVIDWLQRLFLLLLIVQLVVSQQ